MRRLFKIPRFPWIRNGSAVSNKFKCCLDVTQSFLLTEGNRTLDPGPRTEHSRINCLSWWWAEHDLINLSSSQVSYLGPLTDNNAIYQRILHPWVPFNFPRLVERKVGACYVYWEMKRINLCSGRVSCQTQPRCFPSTSRSSLNFLSWGFSHKFVYELIFHDVHAACLAHSVHPELTN